jgi:hypothetical protein
MPRTDSRSKSPITYKKTIDYKPPVYNKPPIYFKPQPIMKPKFFDIIKDGFGFGLGSAIANNTVNAITKSMTTTDKENCYSIKKAFEKCGSDKDCSTEQYLKLENEYNSCLLKN